jgi:nitrate/nitrite-specific signal transduction histidine kinase
MNELWNWLRLIALKFRALVSSEPPQSAGSGDGQEPARRTERRNRTSSFRRAERRLPERVEVAAYYVVSEALTNAAKHAHASVVKVELDAHDAILQLAIRDDGIGGVDPSRGRDWSGSAIASRRSAAPSKSPVPTGSGTTLLIEVPL